MDIDVKFLTVTPVSLPRCGASVKPESWNGRDPKCKNTAKCIINGKKLCRKHGGQYLLALHMKDKET